MQPISRRRFEFKRWPENPSSQNRFDAVALTKLISFAVPILYVIGRVYDESYLGIYGVNNELFARETHDYLYFALLSIFQVTYSAISSSDWSRALIWSLVIPIYVGFLYWLKARRINARTRTKIRSVIASRAARIIGVLSSGLLVVGLWLFLGLLLVFVILLPIAIGLTAGKQVAQDEIQRDIGICEKNHQEILKPCTVVLIDGKPEMVGRVVAATETHMAVAREGEVRVFERNNVTLSAQLKR